MALRSLIALLVLGLVSRQATAFSCYVCSSTVNSTNVESTSGGASCVDLALTSTTDAGNYACQTTYTKTNNGKGSDDTFSIERNVADAKHLATTTGSYCTNTGTSTTCYCSSDKCNSHKVTASRSIQCYSCASSDYFDNGCGMKFDKNGGFAPTVSGCSGCYKKRMVANDMSVYYERGCTRGIEMEDDCEKNGNNKVCSCSKSLCNSADRSIVRSAAAFSTVVLSVVYRLFC